MDSPDEVDSILQSEYRAIVGLLMYLYQWTRPDIGFAITFLSRYLHRQLDKERSIFRQQKMFFGI
jgi:hypothetical protein